MSGPELDTATLRPATGLDSGAREMLSRVVIETAHLETGQIVSLFFRDRFGGAEDYFAGVEATWGHSISFRLRQQVVEAHTEAGFAISWPRPDPEEVASRVPPPQHAGA